MSTLRYDLEVVWQIAQREPKFRNWAIHITRLLQFEAFNMWYGSVETRINEAGMYVAPKEF